MAKVRAVIGFTHGTLRMKKGEEAETTLAVAQQLQKSGHVRVIDMQDEVPAEPAPTPASPTRPTRRSRVASSTGSRAHQDGAISDDQ